MSWEKEKLKEAYKQYELLNNNPGLVAQALMDYNYIKAPYPWGDLDRKYRAMTFMPNVDNKNDIRHIYTNAILTQKYPEEFVRELGLFKEDADLIDFKDIDDTFGDYINNEIGINIGKKYPFAPNEIIFNETLNTIGLPLTPRKNKLYGYAIVNEEPKNELSKYLAE